MLSRLVALEGALIALLDDLGTLKDTQPVLLHVADMGKAADVHHEVLLLADLALLEGRLLRSSCGGRRAAADGVALGCRSAVLTVRVSRTRRLLSRLVGLPLGGGLLSRLAAAGLLLLRRQLGELRPLGGAARLAARRGRGLGVLGLVVSQVGLEALLELLVAGEEPWGRFATLRHLALGLQLAEDDDGNGARELFLASGRQLDVHGVPQRGNDRRRTLRGRRPPGATPNPCRSVLGRRPLTGGLA